MNTEQLQKSRNLTSVGSQLGVGSEEGLQNSTVGFQCIKKAKISESQNMISWA